MKVVLYHDWLTGFRGGERVLEAFCEMFPDAPLYTLIHKKGSVPASIENRPIHTSFLQHVPGIHEGYRKFLPIFPLAAESLRVQEKADLVISSSHCVIKGVPKPPGGKHLCYIHSPMRYIYDQFDNYFGKEAPLYQRIGAHAFRPLLQTWDRSSNENVDRFIANSGFVAKRIRDFYHLDSEIVHPFADLDDFREVQKNPPEKEDYFLMVTAFAPNKRVDLAIRAFNELDLPLKIVGSGQEVVRLRAMAGSKIQFVGNASRERVISLMAKARAFVFPGVEDFGITPLEALAAGTPVIARKVGGVLETLTDETAHFFEEDTSRALINAVKSFDDSKFKREKLLARAEEFSKGHFVRNMEAQIEEVLREPCTLS